MLRKALVGAASCAALAAAAAPSAAELRDLRVGVDGARAEITIAFDAAPTSTAAAPGGGGIVVFASGVAASPRRIETAGASLVRSVDVREGEGGIELDLELTSEAAAARAWVEGGVLRIAVTLSGSQAGAPGAARVTSMSPAASAQTAPGMASAATPGAAPAPGMEAGAAPTEGPSPQTASAAPTPAAPAPGALAAQAVVGPPSAADAVMTAPAPANAIVAPPLRAGGETAPNAASPDAADAIAPEIPTIEPSDASAPPPPRDAARPSVIYSGGVTEEDCEAADTAVRADPWDLDSLKRYAGCRAVDGDLSGSESAFRRLLTIMPDDTEAELGLAAVLHEKGDVAAAAAIYERQLANATGDAQAARLRALIAVAASGN